MIYESAKGFEAQLIICKLLNFGLSCGLFNLAMKQVTAHGMY